MLGNSEAIMAELQTLKAMGVAIVMDDFGTGYSSLSYLWRFPFDKIKIDRSFMQGFDGSGRDAETVVKTIIALGRELHMRVTVEGVETAKQAAFLDGADGDQVQGFFFGRPILGSELAHRDSQEFPAIASGPLFRRSARHHAAGKISDRTVALPISVPWAVSEKRLEGEALADGAEGVAFDDAGRRRRPCDGFADMGESHRPTGQEHGVDVACGQLRLREADLYAGGDPIRQLPVWLTRSARPMAALRPGSTHASGMPAWRFSDSAILASSTSIASVWPRCSSTTCTRRSSKPGSRGFLANLADFERSRAARTSVDARPSREVVEITRRHIEARPLHRAAKPNNGMTTPRLS